MLVRHRNQLHAEVRKQDLDPIMFVTEEPAADRMIVRLKDSALRFELLISPESFELYRLRYSRFSPQSPLWHPTFGFDRSFQRFLNGVARIFGSKTIRVAEEAPWWPTDEWKRIDNVCFHFRKWLKGEVRPALDDLASTDLWRAMSMSDAVFTQMPPGKDAEEFGFGERKMIRGALTEFGSAINTTYKPSSEQLEEIAQRLEYLSGALDRLTKFDWKALAVATLIGIATTLSLDSTQGRHLWALFMETMQGVAHLIS